jgi:predicted heme/steroid binding protein
LKSADTLVADIQGLLSGTDLAGSIEKFKSDIGEMLVRRFREHGENRTPTLRLSNIGKPLRQLWYELNGFKGEELSAETKFKFLYGDILETLVLFLAEAAGHKVERLQEEVEVDGIKGHVDAVIDGRLFDVKSASSFSFKKFESAGLFEAGNDPFGYVGQLKGYSGALSLPASWLVIDKTLGKICKLDLPEDDPYDVKSRIVRCRAAIIQDTPPERCYPDEPDGKSGNRKLGIGCSYCAYKFTCWSEANEGKGLQVYSYSTGPRFLSHVEREPKVDTWETFNKKKD